MNNELEKRYLSVIEDNVNVGKSNVGVEFLILIGAIVAICLMIYMFADSIASFCIDRMSDKTQIQIEKSFSIGTKLPTIDKSKNIENLEKVKKQIISMDKKLQGKSSFPIYEVKDKNINAFILPNGSIYFTKGLADKVQDEEVLAFVLAHELGHYAHRDHLKSISREIIASTIIGILSSQQTNVDLTINSISDLSSLKYSRKQESEADKYAAKTVYKLYGKTTGAVEFFKLLEKEENSPAFMQYFSTHPATKDRIKFIKTVK